MTAHEYAHLARDLFPRVRETELAELARIRERYRRHHIFLEVTEGRGVRYAARGAELGVRPHTIVTEDLAELQAELEQAIANELSAGRSGIASSQYRVNGGLRSVPQRRVGTWCAQF
jgi:hypothetical protein